MKAKIFQYLLGLMAYLAIMPIAEAHTSGANDAGLLAGLSHPFMGLDHLLAMIAVGIWAMQMGGRAVWQVPLTFVSVMSAAAALGSLGFSLPLLEPAIASSVLVLGLLIAGSVRLSVSVGSALVGLFALFHGYAHGLELPQAATPILYGFGFVLATAMLHGLGIGFALSSRQYKTVQRAAGYALVAASGLLLAAA